MKKYFLLLFLLVPTVAKANTVTPSWTNGSMNSTTNSTQSIVETVTTNIYSGDYSSWTGHNVTATGALNGGQSSFDITTPGDNYQLEIVNRVAGQVLENTVINRTIDTTSTTTSLSVFSQ